MDLGRGQADRHPGRREDTGKAGLVIREFEYKQWVLLASVWRGFGADAWGPDGKTCGFATPEMTSAMTFLHQAIFTDKALPGPGTTADFFAGESGLTIAQISRAGLLAGLSSGGLSPPRRAAGARRSSGRPGSVSR